MVYYRLNLPCLMLFVPEARVRSKFLFIIIFLTSCFLTMLKINLCFQCLQGKVLAHLTKKMHFLTFSAIFLTFTRQLLSFCFKFVIYYRNISKLIKIGPVSDPCDVICLILSRIDSKLTKNL